MKVSVVIPCYRSEKTIKNVVENIQTKISLYEDYEIILVNDQSPDNTWKVICEIAKSNHRIKGINLVKNVGQHSAILAGMRYSDGDIVVCSDDDGQTPVENIPLLINKLIEEKYDVTCAKYVSFEKKQIWRRWGTIFFKKIFHWTMDQPENIEVRVFMVVKRYIIDEVCKYEQPYTSINGLILRVTHNIGNIEMVQHARDNGKSGYSLKKLIHTWLNSFTAFSIVPLRVAGKMGLAASFLGLLGCIYVVVKKIFEPGVPLGWSSMFGVILLMSGIILFVLGIIGEYIGRIYMCINGTPQYVIKEYIDYSNENMDEQR